MKAKSVKAKLASMNNYAFIKSGKRTVDIELKAITALSGRIDAAFERACEIMLHCKGRIIVTGMGKSGHIGKKIAATLASTGTPAFFVHPGEASHGDLGMITGQDVVLALSNSGETQEIVTLIPLIKRMGAKLISLSGNSNSVLSQEAVVNLDISVTTEACPLGLAPTASTTASLVMGDAIAIALLDAKGFSTEDFAFSHPGGRLGRRLLLKVEDVMHQGEKIPMVSNTTLLSDALLEMTEKGLGMTAVVNETGQLCGIFTDGDLRRTLDHQIDVHKTPMNKVMTKQCFTVSKDMLAAEALCVMEEHKINALLVVDENNIPVGALNMHDLLRAGVV